MEQVTYMAVGLPKTTEKNFENNVESMMHGAGWDVFESNAEAQADYDRKRALKTKSVLGFVKETQPEEWAKIEKMYGDQAEERFLKRLCDELEPHDERGGVVNVLRHGIRMAPGAQFRLCFFKPATGKNPDAIARYEANRFELVRQLRYGTLPDDKDNSVDTVLFLNGIPVATSRTVAPSCTSRSIPRQSRCARGSPTASRTSCLSTEATA